LRRYNEQGNSASYGGIDEDGEFFDDEKSDSDDVGLTWGDEDEGRLDDEGANDRPWH